MIKFGVTWYCIVTAICMAAAITIPTGQHMIRRQVAPLQQVRYHRSGPVPVLRFRNGPVKRIYVPMKVIPQPQRYPHPPGPYKVVGQPQPVAWKQKPLVQSYRPQSLGPPRKARHPKPKYSQKPFYYQKPIYSYSPKKTSVAYDTYKPQVAYGNAVVMTDSYGAPKPNYKISQSPISQHRHYISTESPKKDDEAPSSYVNVYQGDQTKEKGNPTYSFTQTHGQTYEKKHKGTVYTDSEALVSNHRPVYKHKSDSSVSQTTTEAASQGSFQPPKQTFGFQPYEDTRREADTYTSQPSQQYYKKQPDVLGPNYYEVSST